jgi:uncharacterized protein (TIGR02246 family)
MARLEEIADLLEVRSLVDTYAFAADQRDRERFAGVFTADGTLATGQGGRRYVGREDIANVLNWVEERFYKTMHFVGNQTAVIEGDVAQGLVYCLAHHISNEDGRQHDTVMFVRYVDRYVRTESGWRIEERDLNIEWQEERPLQIP